MTGAMVRGVDFRTLLTIALFCAAVSNVYGVNRDQDHALGNYTEQFTQRIVGGTQASVGEYPYFGRYLWFIHEVSDCANAK